MVQQEEIGGIPATYHLRRPADCRSGPLLSASCSAQLPSSPTPVALCFCSCFFLFLFFFFLFVFLFFFFFFFPLGFWGELSIFNGRHSRLGKWGSTECGRLSSGRALYPGPTLCTSLPTSSRAATVAVAVAASARLLACSPARLPCSLRSDLPACPPLLQSSPPVLLGLPSHSPCFTAGADWVPPPHPNIPPSVEAGAECRSSKLQLGSVSKLPPPGRRDIEAEPFRLRHGFSHLDGPGR